MIFTIDILISTMDRTDLGFLETMMQNNEIDDFNFVIVNQTSPNKLLKSDKKNIKIINSFERGSPRSRNTAINNASSDICLMADDDIIYLPDLKRSILKAYNSHKTADVISFQAIDFEGNLFADYPNDGNHTKKSLRTVCTITISFKRKGIVQKNIYFNHYFGIGSVFQGATEYVFLRNAFDLGMNVYHVSKTIVKHPVLSSGKLMGSDNAFFAKSAMITRYFGNLSYFWLLKYTIFMWKENYININELPHKLHRGISGIRTYKRLKRSGEIEKVYVG